MLDLNQEISEWLNTFIAYPGDEQWITAHNPRCSYIESESRTAIVALSPWAMIAFWGYSPDLPLASFPPLTSTPEGPPANVVTTTADDLIVWAGPPVITCAEFDHLGNGPVFAPRRRVVLVFGQMFDGNLISHALAGFTGHQAELRSWGVGRPIQIDIPGAGFVWIMPMQGELPTIDEQGVRGAWGKRKDSCGLCDRSGGHADDCPGVSGASMQAKQEERGEALDG